MTNSGPESGSTSLRSPEPVPVSALSGNDPGQVAAKIKQVDSWLTDYLLGWFGLADPQPWGAAMSFALETAHGYGLIKGESDSTATPLGLAVADILATHPSGDTL